LGYNHTGLAYANPADCLFLEISVLAGCNVFPLTSERDLAMALIEKKNSTRREFCREVAGAAVAGALVTLDAGAAQNQAEKRRVLIPTDREHLVAVCGLNCGACPMYLGTHSNDAQKLEALLKQFASRPTKLAKEDLLCDGCLGGNRLASFCRNCAIRLCPQGKTNVVRCSDCQDFPCSRITNFNNDGMLHHAEVLNNLGQIRKMGIRDWAKYDEERWQCPQCRAPIAWYDKTCSSCGAKRSESLFPLKQG
jgi:hypothetical protein